MDENDFGAPKGDSGTGKSSNFVKDTATNLATQNSETAQKVAQANRFIQQMRLLGQNILQIGKSIISLAINPVFWIVTGVVAALFIIVMAVMATYSTVGRNDVGDDCGTGSSASVNLHSGDNLSEIQIKENAFMIMNWMMTTPFDSNGGKPLSKEQAAALVANMKEETTYFNPSRIQMPNSMNLNGATATTAQVTQLVNAHNETNAGAIGIFQHRGERAKRMLAIASENGREWNDAASQLQHFKEELDAPGGRGTTLRNQGFFEEGKQIIDYVYLANHYYFGSCRIVKEDRGCAESVPVSTLMTQGKRSVDNATMYVKEFSPTGSGSGGVAHCKGGGANFEGLVELAKSLSNGQVSEWSHPCSIGPNSAYLEARAKQIEAGLGIGSSHRCGSNDDFADCGKFVATLITLLVDKSYPPAGTGVQYSYVTSSSDWVEVTSESELQQGDVLITIPGQTGHTIIYLGEVDGRQNMAASASWDEQLPRVHAYNYVNFTEQGSPGRTYKAFRYVGTPRGILS